jgi:type III secretion protein V
MQEASAMLNRLAASHPEALKELGRALPVMRVAEVLRRLVEEEVSVRNLHIVVETLSDLGQKEKDPAVLTEFVRIALKRHLVLRYAPAGELRALALTPSLETQLREAASTEGGVHQLALDPFVAQTLVAQIGAQAAEAGATVLLTALDLRRPLRKLIEADLFDLGVLAYHELPPSLRLEIVGRLSPIRPMEVGTVA